MLDGTVTQMRKGLLPYCVLAVLEREARYGYELVQELAGEAGMATSVGTIYPLLARLKRDGWVVTDWRESEGGPPRKYYRPSPAGLVALQGFRRQWVAFRRSVDGILGVRAA